MKPEATKHGAFGWFELVTSDQPAATKFYSELFGWESQTMPMDCGGNYTVLKVNGDETGGIMKMPPECGPMPPHWGIYITVDDVDATAAKVEQLGGKLLRPPMDIPKVGRFCVLQDPQGAVICAITYKPQ